MEKKNENKGVENLSKEDQKAVSSLLETIDDDTALAEKYKRWEADEARAALFEEDEKRPVLSVLGLVVGLLGWIALFVMPRSVGEDGNSSFDKIEMQIYIMLAVAVGAFLMSFFGRKRAFGMSVIGMLVSGGLFLFLAIALIVVFVTK